MRRTAEETGAGHVGGEATRRGEKKRREMERNANKRRRCAPNAWQKLTSQRADSGSPPRRCCHEDELQRHTNAHAGERRRQQRQFASLVGLRVLTDVGVFEQAADASLSFQLLVILTDDVQNKGAEKEKKSKSTPCIGLLPRPSIKYKPRLFTTLFHIVRLAFAASWCVSPLIDEFIGD